MSAKKKTTSGKKKAPAKRKKTSKNSTGLWKRIRIVFPLAALVISAVVLIFALRLPPNHIQSPDRDVISQEKSQAPKSSQRLHSREKKKNTGAGGRQYEEITQEHLDQNIREIDLALIQSLILVNIDPGRLEHQSVDIRQKGQEKFHYQTLILKLDPELKNKFIQRFRKYLNDWLSKVQISQIDKQGKGWEISINGLATHKLVFIHPPGAVPQEPELLEPRIAIVVDDMGESMTKARKLIQILGDKATFSILPFSTYTRETVDLAKRNNVDIMLHLPMEPVSFPETDPGPGSLFTSMNDQTIRRIIKKDLRQVPGALGVNNHMGSKFSAYPQGMRVVLQELKKNDLFFMDSLTTPKSQGMQIAEEMGLSSISRDIFLDNKQQVQAILFQLKKAEHLANKKNIVVVSAHPYPKTIQALAQWSKNRDRRIQLCRLSRLVH